MEDLNYPNELIYLIGSDSLQNFHNWKDADQILDNCKFIVA